VLSTWLLVIDLATAYLVGSKYLRSTLPRSSRHFTTVAVVLFLVFTAMLQWIFPSVLSAGRRDAGRIAAGEWWRLGTALLFQDGGVAGTIFNLVSLLLVGGVAERIWGGRRWLLIFVAGGLLSEMVATAWHPVGAGNSVANFSLAGAVSLLCLVRRPTSGIAVAAAVSLAAGLALLLLRDIHGAATLFGAAIGLAFIRLEPRQRDETASSARAAERY
jgi:membrane associated rhomboid family serine protease